MSRIFAKFTGLFLVLALIVAGNHCTLEDLLGNAVPAEHACPVDGSTQQHGSPCKSVTTTLVKSQSIAPLEAIYSLETNLYILSALFVTFSSDLLSVQPSAGKSNTAALSSSLLTRTLALAPNAPPLHA